jgi:hypothetical protein
MNRPIEKSNTDRMVEKNRANVPQPERAGTGPESQTYQQKTGRYVANDEANKKLGTPDTPATSLKPSAALTSKADESKSNK